MGNDDDVVAIGSGGVSGGGEGGNDAVDAAATVHHAGLTNDETNVKLVSVVGGGAEGATANHAGLTNDKHWATVTPLNKNKSNDGINSTLPGESVCSETESNDEDDEMFTKKLETRFDEEKVVIYDV